MSKSPFTILCLASYHKGEEFLRQLDRDGHRVLLVTSKSLENAAWPREAIDEVFYVPDVDKEWNLADLLSGLCHVARRERFDRIVALDDFDVEKAATLREHFRVPGMGDTTARYFRDKLAMRLRAREAGIPVPPFVGLIHDGSVCEYLETNSGPWLIKPRFLAGGIGIKKISTVADFWAVADALGDRRSYHLAERFEPGTVYHVDSIVDRNRVIYAIASRYGLPPMEVAHEGRVFSSTTLERGLPIERRLLEFNERLLPAMGLVEGVSHTEFIESAATGELLFLETSARVGGAHIVDLIEGATGLNLWAEWARLEVSTDEDPYVLPPHREDYAAVLISLARQENPDSSVFDAKEVAWRLAKPHHVGVVVASPALSRVEELRTQYTEKIYSEFFKTEPLRDKPSA